jgi:PQQ-like domain
MPRSTRFRRILPACAAALLVLGCGSRSQLDALGVSGTGSGGGVVAPVGDPCPAAVSGPKAMAGNCSTRDGRSRVAAPSAPHVTWTTKLPGGSFEQAGPSAIATDASGHAYVMTWGNDHLSMAALRRVSVVDGSIDWTAPFLLDGQTGAPIVLSHGGVDLFALDATGTQNFDAVFTFDSATGASMSTTFGFDLDDAPGDVAVGVDGSLYVTHEDGETASVSRVAPDGTVLWTSVDFGALAPPGMNGTLFLDGTRIALGKGDLVVVAGYIGTPTGDDTTSVIALDPATGSARWTTTLAGGFVGGPAVHADGTIVLLTDWTQLVVLDPEKGTPTTKTVAGKLSEMFAVTTGGVVLAGSDTASGTDLVAIGSDGSTLWSGPTGKATIASDGTVISFGAEITALDGASGQMKWQLSPPVPGTCIVDGALTSEGGIVALQCDGTLFGASD